MQQRSGREAPVPADTMRGAGCARGVNDAVDSRPLPVHACSGYAATAGDVPASSEKGQSVEVTG